MTKYFLIMMIAVFGVLLIPKHTHACCEKNGNTEKSCCNKSNSKSKTKDCCKKKHPQEKDSNCGGECGNSSCHCPSQVSYIVLFSVSEIYTKIFPAAKKPIFLNKETYTSSGFFSIWLPPKIS
jgi:hypothetical protein